MNSRYFAELRAGKLSAKRLQGFALQHYIHNIAICKGFALCMVKNAHQSDLYDHFAHQFSEEKDHPALAKKFGLAVGLKEEDFQNALPVFESLAHTGAVLRSMLLASPAENRAGALVNETMVCRYAEEFDIALEKHYGLGEAAREFFIIHSKVDKEHTALAAEVVARYADSERSRFLVRESARSMVRFKIAKFEGIYKAYA
ncbi:MAG: iron-containing redox enzyme family protein [Deltaproteobacteria bacterium]|nr:iron-containing redox enzyme family protein [Deltaproteobacteria bacterium]